MRCLPLLAFYRDKQWIACASDAQQLFGLTEQLLSTTVVSRCLGYYFIKEGR